jgi:hypothetical protein
MTVTPSSGRFRRSVTLRFLLFIIRVDAGSWPLGYRVPAWNGRLRSTLRYRATMKERLAKIQSHHVDECICISVKINGFGRQL